METLYGEKTVSKQDALPERCRSCKSHKHVVYDELLGEEGEVLDSRPLRHGGEARKHDAPTSALPSGRASFRRCIRCNACRNVCPACTCEKCVFDNDEFRHCRRRLRRTRFEESMFHIIRAFHVAGRCTDCGECSRVCPQSIPLHLLNRKFIKDINTLYGDVSGGRGHREPRAADQLHQGRLRSLPSSIKEEGSNA